MKSEDIANLIGNEAQTVRGWKQKKPMLHMLVHLGGIVKDYGIDDKEELSNILRDYFEIKKIFSKREN